MTSRSERTKATTLRFGSDVLAVMARYAPPVREGGKTAFLARLVLEYNEANGTIEMPQQARIHELECWPEDFEAIVRGTKTHDARVDDRGYEVGHILRLLEWIPDDRRAKANGKGAFTGRKQDVRVTCITRNKYGLPPNLAVMSIRKVGSNGQRTR